MKIRWICLLLDEAPFPALMLAFALGQSQVCANSHPVFLAHGESPLAVHVDQEFDKGLNACAAVSEPFDSIPQKERRITSSWRKPDQFLNINGDYGHSIVEYQSTGVNGDE